MKRLILFIALIAGSTGCVEHVTVVPLPPQRPHVPPAALPVELRQENWLGKKRQGSCVYASTVMMLREHNILDIADRVRAKYGDGSWETKITGELRAEGFQVSQTRNADPAFFDYCSANNKGAIIWFKPSHCCYFAGWVKHGGKKYAVIIDNNHIEEYELVEAERFLRLCRSYGGFGCTIVSRTLPDGTVVNCDPINPVPWASYRLERR